MKDLLGILCSGMCIIHCLLTPILLLLGASGVGIVFIDSEWVHLVLAIPMVALAFWSIFLGWKAHRKSKPIFFAGGGLILLFSSLIISEQYEAYLAITAGLLLISAHLFNLKLVKQSALQWVEIRP